MTVLVALLIGCAGTPSAADAALSEENVAAHNKMADKRDQVVCEYVKDIGSYRRVKQCRTIAQKEKEYEEARRVIADGSDQPGSGGDGQ